MKKLIFLIMMIVVVVTGCGEKNKGIQTTTPQPLENIVLGMDAGSYGKFVLSVGDEGAGVLRRLSDGAEVNVEVMADDDGFFEFGTVYPDGMNVWVSGYYLNNQISNVSVVINDVSVSITIYDPDVITDTDKADPNSNEEDVPAEVFSFKKVAAGNQFTCAIDNDGGVWCWGSNASCQIGLGADVEYSLTPKLVEGISDAAFIATDDEKVCVIKSDKKIWCWGEGSFQPTEVSGLEDSVFIELAGGAIYSITAAGNVVAKMNDGIVVTTMLTDIVDLTVINPASAALYALKSNGIVQEWTYSGGLVAPNIIDDVVGITSAGVSIYGYKGDGSVWLWGVTNEPVSLLSVEGLVEFDISSSYVCMLDSTTTLSCEPVGVANEGIVEVSDVESFSIGDDHACEISLDGDIYCWGANTFGQLGTGDAENKAAPTKIEF